MDKVWEFIIGIVTGKKTKLFWLGVIILVLGMTILYPYIDANYFYYNRISKRIDNLHKMVTLTNEPLEENEALRNEYNNILDEMETAREKAISTTNRDNDIEGDRKIKFYSGAGLWYLISIIIAFSKKKNEKWSTQKVMNNILAAVVCALLGTLIGYVFTLVPSFGDIVSSIFISISAEIIILWLLFGKSKKKNDEEQKNN